MRTSNEYNRNWPVLDGETLNQGPVTIDSIRDSKSGRFIANLRAMIENKEGELVEASISWPESWGLHNKFSKGDRVTVDTEGGYLKRINHLKVVPLKKATASGIAASVNESVKATVAGEPVAAEVIEEKAAAQPIAEVIAAPAGDMPF
jgi:hypothetical protein